MSSNSVNTPVIIYVASQTCIHLSIKASPTGFKNEELQIPQLHISSCLNKLQIRRDNSSIKNEKCMHYLFIIQFPYYSSFLPMQLLWRRILFISQ